MTTILLFLVLSVCLQETDCVLCFSSVDLSSGRCEDELGDVDINVCCQNINYGYHDNDGTCHYCGPRAISQWSSWSQCSELCGEGYRSRSRKCLGNVDLDKREPDPECRILKNFLSEPCNATTCCSAAEWKEWSSWSACSVTCGARGGVKERVRACHSEKAECVDTCEGEKHQSQPCTSDQTCPVHGSWSGWTSWSECSSTCIMGVEDESMWAAVFPTRCRHRTCDKPAPSSDTVPPGNNCPGEEYEMEGCTHLPNCPVDGGWGPWGPWGPCSVSCGEGLQLSIRRCDTPTPKYGGKQCDGHSTKSEVCNTTCPVHGGWTGWSYWGQCSTSCIPEGSASTRTRSRSCTNPAPSSSGIRCFGDGKEKGHCDLPHCPVDGGWGSWSSYTSCSVTCGVGVQRSFRDCKRPAQKHGGLPCEGAGNRTLICETNPCPVNGKWSDWSEWSICKNPSGKNINCTKTGGTQSQHRECLYQRHGGEECDGDKHTEKQPCYDVEGCKMKGSWEGWGVWSECQPSCGNVPSNRSRRRTFKPDFTGYRSIINGIPASFYGTPKPERSSALPEGEDGNEEEPCLKIPACPP